MKRPWSVHSLASSTCVLLLALVVAAPTPVTAQPVVSVTLSPTTITGGTGGAALGTVTISGPAPAGGQVINLTSSNTDLAASAPSIVIPAGATSATFTVGTNSLYRPYSGLAFNATITATNPGDGSSASATLTVTAQAIPGPFTGGTVSTQANAAAGRMCGGSFGTSSAVGLISPLGGFDIPQGATTALFDVDTLGVAVPAFVQVRADLFLNPQQRYAQDYLAVVPVAGSRPPSGPLAVFDVSLTPMAVVQGNPSIGTVILNGVAPSGGAVVSLFSDNSAALPPASVTVA